MVKLRQTCSRTGRLADLTGMDDNLDDIPELTEADLAIAWCRILAMAGIDEWRT